MNVFIVILICVDVLSAICCYPIHRFQLRLYFLILHFDNRVSNEDHGLHIVLILRFLTS